jgi:hypothetical protein
MSVLVSKGVRVCVLAAIAVAIASGHPSAAKRPYSHKLDSALAGVAGKGYWLVSGVAPVSYIEGAQPWPGTRT